jgi:hypothetical protein
MASTQWRLRQVLHANNLSAYALAQELAKQTRPNTIYRLVRVGQEPSRVDLSTLTLVILGLRRLTGKHFDVADILEYVDEP